MSERLECTRAEQLLAERVEGELAEPERSALEAHLAGCGGCRELAEALAFVVETLRAVPQVAPPPDLAERAASRALARVSRPWLLPRPHWASPAPLPIAAALAMAVTGAALVLASPGSVGAIGASRLVGQTVNAREYLLERGDRLLEDLRLLRLVVGTAFEARLERVNDRVEDYRRLLERRRERGPGDEVSLESRLWVSRGFANPNPCRCVDAVGARAPRATRSPRPDAASSEGA